MNGSAAGYGTLAWAKGSRGALTRRELLRELAKSTRVIAHMVPDQLRHRLGLRKSGAFAYDVARLPIPDSGIAKQAEDLCRESSTPMLVNHSLRTYAWGMILAAHDGLQPDPELFYVASMLHDLALTDQFRGYDAMPCFGARAAILAHDWARARGWPDDRCGTLADAICLHLNVAVPAAHGPEAQMLQAGAGLDVIGLRYGDLSPDTVAAIVSRYPRHAMKTQAYPLFGAESHPGTRTRLLNRWLLFGTMIRFSQFDE